MNIRPYQVTDRPQLETLVVELQEYERRIQPRMRPGASIVVAYVDQLLAHLESGQGQLIVAESGEIVVGFLAVLAALASEPDEVDYHYAYVSDLVVLPEYRDQGIATVLLASAEQYSREQGARLLRVAVLAQNQGACRLYRGSGFTEREILFEKNLFDN